MARLLCNLCEKRSEATFFEHWNCYDCGADWGIRLLGYEPKELVDSFAFINSIRKANAPLTSGSHVLVLAKDFEDPDDPSAGSLVDTCLLFFDRLIVPDWNIKDFVRALGEEKASQYRSNELIYGSDNSFIATTFRGLNTPKTFRNTESDPMFEFDFELGAPPALDNIRFYNVLDNLDNLYINELLHLLRRTNLFNQNRIGQTNVIRLRGVDYIDGELVHIIPKRFLRNEMFSHLFHVDFLVDDYYAIATTLRETYYRSNLFNYGKDFNLFNEWLKSSRIQKRSLDPNSLMDFRAKYGTLGPLIRDIREEISFRLNAPTTKELLRQFCAEIEKRISNCHKVMGKEHERKGIYLRGLMSTLGAVVGGVPGAVIGGIGGTAASELALEYDRRIAAPLAFVADMLEK